MNRQNINIGEFEFIADLYSAEEKYTPVVYKEYVILRNILFNNNVGSDKDIYFMEKNIYEKIKGSNKTINDIVVFPYYNSENSGNSFTKDYKDFITMLDPSTFKLDNEGGNIFSLYKHTNTGFSNENVFIKCDKIKIYHPHNKTDLTYIIYIDNIINGIHFHYFCNYNTNCKIKSENEFKVHNNYYSEYIELYIPNIDFLFKEHKVEYNSDGTLKKDDNIYFNDFYNLNKYIDVYPDKIKKNSSWISMSKENVKEYFNDYNTLSMIPLYLLLHPYITVPLEKDGIEQKIYFKMTYSECNNYNSLPLNITLFPFDTTLYNNMLIYTSEYPTNSDTFVKEYHYELISKIAFKHNQLCIVNTFEFNNKYDPVKNPNGLSIQEAYGKYNGLTVVKNENGEWYCPQYIGWVADELYEYEDESFIKCCGYQMDIATDYSFKSIIASSYQEMDFINDFDFSLLNLFDDWYQLPQTMVIRIKFIDKYLGVTLQTGYIILNKEYVKYTINTSNIPRIINDFRDKQNDLTNMAWNKYNAKETTFNFIDKINCVVNKNDDTNTNLRGNGNGVRVIYKPIFYKTQALQFISIKTGLKQKVGINLSQYMTKVSMFKLIIDDVEINEYGRNDIYVIFEIDANDISNTSGNYNIVDYDNNYISSGTYNIS